MSIGDNLKTWAQRIKRDGVTLWFAGKNPRTPWYAKALGVFVVAYALSPIDLIPNFIPALNDLYRFRYLLRGTAGVAGTAGTAPWAGASAGVAAMAGVAWATVATPWWP